MTRNTTIFILIFYHLSSFGQNMKPLNELINKAEPAWVLIEEWKKGAKNKIEILPIKSQTQADTALYIPK
jgi:hypothetical protein